jgi:hypothetical protein
MRAWQNGHMCPFRLWTGSHGCGSQTCNFSSEFRSERSYDLPNSRRPSHKHRTFIDLTGITSNHFTLCHQQRHARREGLRAFVNHASARPVTGDRCRSAMAQQRLASKAEGKELSPTPHSNPPFFLGRGALLAFFKFSDFLSYHKIRPRIARQPSWYGGWRGDLFSSCTHNRDGQF